MGQGLLDNAVSSHLWQPITDLTIVGIEHKIWCFKQFSSGNVPKFSVSYYFLVPMCKIQVPKMSSVK